MQSTFCPRTHCPQKTATTMLALSHRPVANGSPPVADKEKAAFVAATFYDLFPIVGTDASVSYETRKARKEYWARRNVEKEIQSCGAFQDTLSTWMNVLPSKSVGQWTNYDEHPDHLRLNIALAYDVIKEVHKRFALDEDFFLKMEDFPQKLVTKLPTTPVRDAPDTRAFSYATPPQQKRRREDEAPNAPMKVMMKAAPQRTIYSNHNKSFFDEWLNCE